MKQRDLFDLSSGLINGEFIHKLDILTLKTTRPGGETKVPKGLIELKGRCMAALDIALNDQERDLVGFREEMRRSGSEQRHIERAYAACDAMQAHRLEAIRLVDYMTQQYKQNMVRMARTVDSSSEYNIKPGLEAVVEEIFSEVNAHAFLTSASADVQALSDMCVAQLAASSETRKGDLHLAEAHLKVHAQKRIGWTHATHGEGTLDEGAEYPRSLYVKCSACAVLLLWAVSECFNNETRGRHIWSDPTFSIFMCLGDILLLLWMFAGNIVAWDAAGVDYVALLELQAVGLGRRLYAPAYPVLNVAANMTLAYLFAFVAFNKALRGVFSADEDLPLAHAFPALLVIYMLYAALANRKLRELFLFEYLGRVLIAPWSDVIFRDSYVGDLLTSTVRVSLQLAFAIGYALLSLFAWFDNDMELASSAAPHDLWKQSVVYKDILVPILTLAPLWLRFVQCLRRSVETGQRWPHLCNALKYCSAMAAISFSVFNADVRQYSLWILAITGATLFQYWWDIFQDWGLLVPAHDAQSSGILVLGTTYAVRSPLLMGSVYTYMLVAAVNLVLRFAWALTLLDMPSVTDQQLEGIDTDADRGNEDMEKDGSSDAGALYEKTTLLLHLYPIMAALEVFRRMVWSVLRVEWEHIEVERKSRDNTNGRILHDSLQTDHQQQARLREQQLKASIEYEEEGIGGGGEDEVERLLGQEDGMKPMAMGEQPRWTMVQDLGVISCLSAISAMTVRIGHGVLGRLASTVSVDWYPTEDYWLRTFPRITSFLYSTRFFRALVHPTKSDVSLPRLIDSFLLAASMIAVMLVALCVEL